MSVGKHMEWQAAECHRLSVALATAEQERDAAVADNAALVAAAAALKDACNERLPGEVRHIVRVPWSALATALAAPHPGAAMLERHRKDVEAMRPAWERLTTIAITQGRSIGGVLDDAEQHRKEMERLSAALAAVQRKVENWSHGEECAARGGWNDDDEPAEGECDCGKSELLAIINPSDGSLPGAAFLARCDTLANELEEAKRGLVRARNEGLERAAVTILTKRDAIASRRTPGTRRGGLEEAAAIARALKDPEE